MPEVATLQELGINVPVMPGWYALIGPAGIDPAISKVLQASLEKTFKEPEVQQRLKGLGMFIVGGTAERARERGLNDSTIWGELIRAQNIQLN